MAHYSGHPITAIVRHESKTVRGRLRKSPRMRCPAPGGFGGSPGQLLYTGDMTELADTFDSAFAKAVDLGNRLADKDKDADLWDIADGLLAGALQ